MRDGTCDKCGGAVRQLTMGISQGGGQGVIFNDGARIRRPISHETFLCTACGYFEDYITDPEKLRAAAEGRGGWAPPTG